MHTVSLTHTHTHISYAHTHTHTLLTHAHPHTHTYTHTLLTHAHTHTHIQMKHNAEPMAMPETSKKINKQTKRRRTNRANCCFNRDLCANVNTHSAYTAAFIRITIKAMITVWISPDMYIYIYICVCCLDPSLLALRWTSDHHQSIKYATPLIISIHIIHFIYIHSNKTLSHSLSMRKSQNNRWNIHDMGFKSNFSIFLHSEETVIPHSASWQVKKLFWTAVTEITRAYSE